MKIEFSLEWFKEHSAELKLLHIQFGDGEGGWAGDLGDGLAVILNTPLEPRLMFFDVVRLETKNGLQAAGEVIWRGYDSKTGVYYPATCPEISKKSYNDLWRACKALGLGIEGYTHGSCAISHGKDLNLPDALRSQGVDVAALKFESDW